MTNASQTPLHDNTEAELDANSLNAIRSILTEEVAAAPRRTARSQGPAQGQGLAAEETETPRAVAGLRRKADAFPELDEPAHSPNAENYEDLRSPTKRRFSFGRKRAAAHAHVARPAAPYEPSEEARGGIAKLKAYRPTPKHIALAAIALLVFLRPWLVLGLVFISLFILTGVFLAVGYDGFWRGVMKLSRWYASRRPERAAALHTRLDRFAMRWDAVLDRFPEGSVDALYLPDFGDLATADRRHDEAMDRRLSGLQENGV